MLKKTYSQKKNPLKDIYWNQVQLHKSNGIFEEAPLTWFDYLSEEDFTYTTIPTYNWNEGEQFEGGIDVWNSQTTYTVPVSVNDLLRSGFYYTPEITLIISRSIFITNTGT